MADNETRTVRSSAITLQVIDQLHKLEGAHVTELASELNMAPSTIHGHLSTLRQEGYVVKNGDEYKLGLRFLEIGENLRKDKDLYPLAREKVDQLVKETKGRCHFAVRENSEGVYLFTGTGEHAVETFSGVGKRFSLHSSAAGKALLSGYSDNQIADLLDLDDLDPKTDNTIVDKESFFEEIEAVRSRGVAFNDEEHLSGLRAVAVPVSKDNDEIVGAFVVSGPTHRMKGEWYEHELPDLLLGVANEVELTLTYQ